MKTFRGEGLFWAGTWSGTLEGNLGQIHQHNPNSYIGEGLVKTSVDCLRTIRDTCNYFELPASEAACDDLINLLGLEKQTPKTVQVRLDEFRKRMSAELAAHLYFYIPKGDAARYQKPRAGWEEAIEAFPSTTYDSEEASKCVALHRNTAAVFHLMRVTGAGVKALGKSLNEPNVDASRNVTWDNVLARCVRELGETFSGKSPEWQSDKQFYAEATTKLLAMKDAWRNPNAHEVGQKYTDEEALEVYTTTRSFMRQLAKKLKEVNPSDADGQT
jgi:hypothetical protein